MQKVQAVVRVTACTLTLTIFILVVIFAISTSCLVFHMEVGFRFTVYRETSVVYSVDGSSLAVFVRNRSGIK